MKDTKRKYNYDLLRILACIMVISIHVSAKNFYKIPLESFDWNILNIFDSISRASVSLFFMISGAFFLNKKIDYKTLYKKYILKYLILYIIYSIIYGIIEWYKLDTIHLLTFSNIKIIIKNSIIGSNHLWFLITLITLYAISPFMKKALDNLESKDWKNILIIAFIFILLNSIYKLDVIPYYKWIKIILDKIPLSMLCQYYIYFILGYYFMNIDKKENNRTLIYLAAFIINVLLCIVITKNISIIKNHATPVAYDYLFIFTYIEAICLFKIFNNKQIISVSNKHKKIIKYISDQTLNIYLIHMIFVNFIFDKQINVLNYGAIIYVPLLILIIFLLSLLTSIIINKIKRVVFSKA